MTKMTTNKDIIMEVRRSLKDGARAWTVAFAATVTMALTAGLYRSLGILVVELMEVFEASTSESSLLFTCYGITFTLTALLINTSLGDVVHERALIVAGSSVGSLGFIFTYFAAKIEHVTYVLGLCLGMSTQIGICCSLSMIGKYFERRLAVATSVVVSGISLGMLVWPFILRYLLDVYTYKGASLILGGIMLNCWACAALMEPLPESKRRSYHAGRYRDDLPVDKAFVILDDRKAVCDKICLEEQAATTIVRNQQANKTRKTIKCVNNDANVVMSVPVTTVKNTPNKHTICDSFLGIIMTFVMINQSDSKPKVTLSQIFALSLFKNPIFALYFVFSLTVYFANECIVQLYPSILHDVNLAEYQSAFLLSLTGLSGIVGRIASGCLGDYIKKRYKVVALSQAIIGVAVVLNQFAMTFWAQIVYAVTMGLVYGIPYVYRIALMKDFFQLVDISKMIGITGFASGIGSVCGFPLIGWLRDHTGGYLLPLYLIGALYLLNTAILLTMPLLQSLYRRKQDQCYG